MLKSLKVAFSVIVGGNCVFTKVTQKKVIHKNTKYFCVILILQILNEKKQNVFGVLAHVI